MRIRGRPWATTPRELLRYFPLYTAVSVSSPTAMFRVCFVLLLVQMSATAGFRLTFFPRLPLLFTRVGIPQNSSCLGEVTGRCFPLPDEAGLYVFFLLLSYLRHPCGSLCAFPPEAPLAKI